jgi:branched-chain amino acid transport system permease protein
MQIIINILISSSLYLIISLSFLVIYQTIKFFHISHGILITFGGYLFYTFYRLLSINFVSSLFLSIIFTVLVGLLVELIIYRKLRLSKSSSLSLTISSLGIYVIFQNMISLFWGVDPIALHSAVVKTGHVIFSAYITDIQIITIGASLVLYILTTFILNYSKIGLKIRALSSNEELANVFGINSNRVIIWSISMGSVLAATSGILYAFDTSLTPTMGFNLLLYGVVAMIIGGVGSTWGLIGGSLLLAAAQHLGAYYIDSKWMDTIAYIILILFLIWKPLGFSGKRLKKIEI